MDRKLASIRIIDEIRPHPNADLLELAMVGGWQVVVKKGDFTVGDKAVYFEVDSVLPVAPEYEFLRKCCYVKKDWVEGFRLKTIKLRGELSQGLLVPVPAGLVVFDGRDVTEVLNVVKWDPPIPASLAGQAKGNFPSFIPKTDQERVQNLTREVAQAYDNEDYFEVTTKLDGTSFTAYYFNGKLGVCSRNLELQINEINIASNTHVQVLVNYGLGDALIQFGRNIAIQGELMGPGIQGNRESLKEPMLFVFDIYSIDENRYLTPDERRRIFVDHFGGIHNVHHVPVLSDVMTLPSKDVHDILKMADGDSIHHPIREGIVFKRMDGAFSFKAISNEFLLKEK